MQRKERFLSAQFHIDSKLSRRQDGAKQGEARGGRSQVMVDSSQSSSGGMPESSYIRFFQEVPNGTSAGFALAGRVPASLQDSIHVSSTDSPELCNSGQTI